MVDTAFAQRYEIETEGKNCKRMEGACKMDLFTLGKQAGKQRIMKGYSGGHVIANRLHKALRQIRETK